MFGIFKKKAPAGSFITVAIQSALILRKIEKRNGGIYSSPADIQMAIKAIAKDMNYELSGNLSLMTESCVMALLMDQKILDKLLARAQNDGLGQLTALEEKEIETILAPILN